MSLNHLLNQTITIENQTAGRDKHGRMAFSTGVDSSARFQQTNRTITTVDREREPIDGIIFLPANTTVSVGDRITYSGIEYRVMRIDSMVGYDGTTDHFEVMVQKWSFA